MATEYQIYAKKKTARRHVPAQILLRWYRRYGRALPWRQTKNPYRILISEIMLQQTQVDRVKKFYRAWLKQFPDWQALSIASNAEVISAWAGLGYNRRALILRNLAREVIQKGVPQTQEEWVLLKGLGSYTAAAISVFAQKKRTLPIDTNIRRVMGRFLLGKPFPDPGDDKRIQACTDTFLPRRGHYYDVPQALFDLAGMICKKNPACEKCPLRKHCKASTLFLNGSVSMRKKSTPVSVERRHRNKPYPDRIYRGRILKLVRERGQVRMIELGPEIDVAFDRKRDETWLESMVVRLQKDDLITKKGTILSL